LAVVFDTSGPCWARVWERSRRPISSKTSLSVALSRFAALLVCESFAVMSHDVRWTRVEWVRLWGLGLVSVCLYTGSRVFRTCAARADVVMVERSLGEEAAVMERRHKGGENIGNASAALRTRGQRCSIRLVWHESPCSRNGSNSVRTSRLPEMRDRDEGRIQPGEQMSSSPAFDDLPTLDEFTPTSVDRSPGCVTSIVIRAYR